MIGSGLPDPRGLCRNWCCITVSQYELFAIVYKAAGLLPQRGGFLLGEGIFRGSAAHGLSGGCTVEFATALSVHKD